MISQVAPSACERRKVLNAAARSLQVSATNNPVRRHSSGHDFAGSPAAADARARPERRIFRSASGEFGWEPIVFLTRAYLPSARYASRQKSNDPSVVVLAPLRTMERRRAARGPGRKGERGTGGIRGRKERRRERRRTAREKDD